MSIIKKFREENAFFMAMPAFLWQNIFLFIPLLSTAFFSVIEYSSKTGYSITFKHYQSLLTPIYFKVIFNSLFLAGSTAFLTLLIAYPIAYFLALKMKRGRTLLLFLIILPSWTNIIIQVYAWFFLLEKNGLINSLLKYMGLIATPFHFLNNTFATLLGMIYCFLPFMVLPLFTVMEKIDKRLFEASADLGANWLYTFRHVIFPLSLPGIYTGLFLVAIPSFGEFAIPTLLGGAKKAYWGSIIVEKFLMLGSWASGFAVAILGIMVVVLLMLILLTCYTVFNRIKTSKYHGLPKLQGKI